MRADIEAWAPDWTPQQVDQRLTEVEGGRCAPPTVLAHTGAETPIIAGVGVFLLAAGYGVHRLGWQLARTLPLSTRRGVSWWDRRRSS